MALYTQTLITPPSSIEIDVPKFGNGDFEPKENLGAKDGLAAYNALIGKSGSGEYGTLYKFKDFGFEDIIPETAFITKVIVKFNAWMAQSIGVSELNYAPSLYYPEIGYTAISPTIIPVVKTTDEGLWLTAVYTWTASKDRELWGYPEDFLPASEIRNPEFALKAYIHNTGGEDTGAEVWWEANGVAIRYTTFGIVLESLEVESVLGDVDEDGAVSYVLEVDSKEITSTLNWSTMQWGRLFEVYQEIPVVWTVDGLVKTHTELTADSLLILSNLEDAELEYTHLFEVAMSSEVVIEDTELRVDFTSDEINTLYLGWPILSSSDMEVGYQTELETHSLSSNWEDAELLSGYQALLDIIEITCDLNAVRLFWVVTEVTTPASRGLSGESGKREFTVGSGKRTLED